MIGAMRTAVLSAVMLLAPGLAAFAGWTFDDIIDGRTEREVPVYAVGETMTFTFTLRGFKGLDASKCSFDWVRTGDDGKAAFGRAPADKPLVLTTSIGRPGFVRYYVELLGADNKPVLRDVMDDGDNYKVRFDGGAGADILSLRPDMPEPKDFDAFWTRMKARLEAVPWKEAVKVVRLDSGRDDVELYTVEIPCAGGRPATGFLTIPTAAKDGKRFPADISFYGYGGSWSTYATQKPAAKRLRTDVIQFLSSAHGFELMREPSYYATLRRGLSSNGHGYAFDPVQNADPEKSYFSGMVLRVLRGLEYLKSRPEWNGRDLVAHGGSMGGLQTVWAAALDPDVTHALAEAPWCCDIAGMERRKHVEDWHVRWAPGLGYYDPVNLARRIPKTCLFELPRIGLGDYICPPAGVMRFYNALTCPKRGVCFQNTRHDYKAPAPRQEFSLEGDAIRASKSGSGVPTAGEDGSNYNLSGER